MAAPFRAAAAPSEYDVKAVFLFNFSQFVSWPAATFTAATDPFVVGIVGRDPFGTVLDSVVQGEHAGTHPLVVRRFRDAAELGPCQLLFISQSELPHLAAILRSLSGQHTLTVTDGGQAAKQGVMVDLVTDGRRIRLQINLEAAEAAGLTLSSKLLRPSEIVATEAGGR